MKTTSMLRWIAILPVTILVFYATFLLGLLVTVSLPCPADSVISGLCTASWHQDTSQALQVIFAGIAAFLIVVAAAATAPSHKLHVAWIAYVAGSAFAVFVIVDKIDVPVHFYAAFIGAVVSGLLAVSRVAKYLGLTMLPTQSLREAGVS